MKKYGNTFAIYSMLLFLCFSTAAFAGPIPQFTIMTEDWEPYNFEKDGVVKGVSVDMLVLMLEKVGLPQGRDDIKIYPWARAYKNIQENPNTILFTTTRTAERENLFKWVGPIFENKFNVYALKSRKIIINSFEDLKKFKIATLRADASEEMLIKKAGMKAVDFLQVSENRMITKMLSAGRADITVFSEETLIATCNEAGLNFNDFESVITLDKIGMYYAFHKETPDSVITLFQNAFNDIKKAGKLDELMSKYKKSK